MTFVITDYWEKRYRAGGFSGAGSRGDEAKDKVELVQRVVNSTQSKSLLDLGCGDGHIASGIIIDRYVGYDPSDSALALCRKAMPDRQFTSRVYPYTGELFGLIISMDVIFHLVDDEAYHAYLDLLFCGLAPRVLVYATDHDQRGNAHVLHRHWTPDIPNGWDATELRTKFKKAWLIERA